MVVASPSMTVRELKERITTRTMLPVEFSYLTLAGKVLTDELSLEEATGHQLRDATLHVRLRNCSGTSSVAGTSSAMKGSRAATPTEDAECRCPSRARVSSPEVHGAELQPELKRARTVQQSSADNLVPWLAGWAVQ